MFRKMALVFIFCLTTLFSLSACSTTNNNFNHEVETQTIENFEDLKSDKKLYNEAKSYADNYFKNRNDSDKIILFKSGAYLYGSATFINGNAKKEYNSKTDKDAITVSVAKEIMISKYIKGEIKHETK